VPKPLLHAPGIHAFVEHMRRARVAQGVRRDVSLEASGPGMMAGHQPHRLTGQGRAGRIEKHRICRSIAKELRPAAGKISANGGNRPLGDGRDTLPARPAHADFPRSG
jgi:hypothetical protein